MVSELSECSLETYSFLACNETNLMQFIQSLHLYMFWLASNLSSGGNNVYMQQLVCVICLSQLPAGLVEMRSIPTRPANSWLTFSVPN
jgi:hypothetical protein